MGNANSTVFETHDCHDNASRRHNNRPIFQRGVQAVREELASTGRPATPPLRGSAAASAQRPRVVFRKRPMFEGELTVDFDVLTSDGAADVWGEGAASAMWVTRAMLCADHKTMYTESHAFYADAVFDEDATTEELYKAAVQPLVRDAFCCVGGGGGGERSTTVLCFGQTGSGKTFTLGGIFDALRADMPCPEGGWRVSAYEIAGGAVSEMRR